MATKSENTKGNPYHDDEGKFTSESGQGSKTEKVAAVLPIKLKEGVDLSNLKQEIAAKTNPLENDLVMPKTIQEAQEQGNRIIGSTLAVGYDDSTDIRVAFDLNCALKDITKDFKEIMTGDQLWIYGTKNNRTSSIVDFKKAANEVINEPAYQQIIKDLGLNNNDIDEMISKMVNNYKMFEEGFNASTLQKGCGGSTGFVEGDAYGYPSISVSSSVKFNTIYSQSKINFDKYPVDAIKEGHFLPIGDKTGAYMVGVHELGHHVFQKLKAFFSDDDKVQLENALTDGKGYKAFRVTPLMFGGLFGFNGPVVNDYEKLQQAKEISGYATTSQHEHVAEAFANVYCMGKNATSHNKKIVKFLKSVYDRIYASKI